MVQVTDFLEQAKLIVSHGPNVSYPSRASAQHVRDVMQGLVAEIERRRRREEARDDDEALWT